MAIVIEFRDIVEARRQRRQRESLERCVEILEDNLRHALWMSDYGPVTERERHAHRVEILSALRDYAELAR